MMVAAYAGSGLARIEERPEPVPAAGELVLRLRACGLCGTDLFKLAAGDIAPGTVLGHEVVGVVDALGPDAVDERGVAFVEGERLVVPHHVACGACRRCAAGSETMCEEFKENMLAPGGFAERILVRRRAVARAARRVPDHVADEAAVFLEPAACVLRGIDRARSTPGAVSIVLGGGSMGLLHALVLRAFDDTARVIVVDPIDGRRAIAESLGATAAHPADAARVISDISSDRGADAVFDTVGGAACLDSALRWTREGGVVVLFAHAPPGERSAFDLNALFKTERSVVATYSGALREQARVFDALVSGVLDPSPLVTARLPLSRFDEALARVRSRTELKVLLHP